jgi:Tfp pilus assembly protein PilF
MMCIHRYGLSVVFLVLTLVGCAQQPPAVVGLSEITARPGERALFSGLSAYENGQYVEAEKHFERALSAGLVSSRDTAEAHKHLAFIYCSNKRTPECEAAFRAARKANSAFVLSRSEQGHPVWGPVYKRVLP